MQDKAAACPFDLVNRQFHAPAPNKLWDEPKANDFTYVSTWSGMVYVAFVIDVFARRIVGWRVSRTQTAGFVLDALEQAMHARQPADSLIHHSDRGSQGGFKRSSQHPTRGCCDGQPEASISTVRPQAPGLARPTPGGRA